MTEQDLDEWVAASLRYLLAACGTDVPWADASSNEEGQCPRDGAVTQPGSSPGKYAKPAAP